MAKEMKTEQEIIEMIESINADWFGVPKSSDKESYNESMGWIKALHWVLKKERRGK